MPGYAFNGPVLFDIAKQACERAASNRVDTIVAIVFAAAGLECFLNEVLERLRFAFYEQTPEIARARTIAEAAGLYGTSASLEVKVQLLSASLTGSLMDRGAQPYQDLDLLVALRNWLVHHRPQLLPEAEEGEEATQHKLVSRLVAGRVIDQPSPGPPMAAIGPVTDPKVARWAFNASLRMVHTLSRMYAPGRNPNVIAPPLFGYHRFELFD